MEKLKFVRTRDVKKPVRGTKKSAGLDFFIPNDFIERDPVFNPDRSLILYPGESVNIPSGVHVKIPDGHMLLALNKSGVAVKKNLHVGAQVIDEDYQGEVHLNVTNVGGAPCELFNGEKLTQLVAIPVSYFETEEIAKLESLFKAKTERGISGFGSTGSD